MDLREVKEVIEKHKIRTVIVAGTDPAGGLRGKRLTVPYFYHAVEDGLFFASFILGTTTMDDVLPGLFDTGIPDLKGEIDLDSFRLAPWEADTAIVMMDWRATDGSPTPLCPRSLLKQQVELARTMGFDELASLELEFYILPVPLAEVRAGRWTNIEPAAKDIHCYSILEGHFWEPIISRIRECFPDEVEGCLPEWGQGQFEINLHRSDAVSMADNSMLLKLALKQIAAKAGATATFMAKWHEGYSGSSGHIHLSLRDRKTGRSAFYAPERPLKVSERFEQFTAGQLDVFAPSVLLYAPNVNSYKRYQTMSFAGTTRSWGVDNRTVGFRAINLSEGKCRLEIRLGGADLNPYLAMSTALGAGLRGIKKGLKAPPASTGNSYDEEVERVPSNLATAVAATENHSGIREVLPAAVVDNVVRIAKFELGVFQSTVTDLERRRYLETV
jgi:glutamine synthetase